MYEPVTGLRIAQCLRCKESSLWVGSGIVFPRITVAPPPNTDLPEAIAADYEEARQVLPVSPRGAAALLRLVIQKLCKHLGESGKDINADIGSLVKKGLPATVQQALDIVRVIGNNAVHPGQLDLKDDPETAHKLFTLVNIITDYTISQPKQIATLFESLPDPQRDQIAKRDSREPS